MIVVGTMLVLGILGVTVAFSAVLSASMLSSRISQSEEFEAERMSRLPCEPVSVPEDDSRLVAPLREAHIVV